MLRCRDVRPLLSRAAEDDTSPAESLRLARHLPRCTACRILLARETRLAEMLGAIGDPVVVDGEFVERVMSALPEGAPASSPVRKRRRGLAIAGLGGLVAVAGAAISGLGTSGSAGGPLPGLPRVTYEGLDSLHEIFGGLVRLVALVVARAGSGLESTLPRWSPDALLLPAAVVPLALTLVMLSMLVALAAGGYSRVQAIPRACIRLLSASSGMASRFAVADRSPRSSVQTRRM